MASSGRRYMNLRGNKMWKVLILSGYREAFVHLCAQNKIRRALSGRDIVTCSAAIRLFVNRYSSSSRLHRVLLWAHGGCPGNTLDATINTATKLRMRSFYSVSSIRFVDPRIDVLSIRACISGMYGSSIALVAIYIMVYLLFT